MPSIVLKEKNPVRVVIAMGVALRVALQSRLPAGCDTWVVSRYRPFLGRIPDAQETGWLKAGSGVAGGLGGWPEKELVCFHVSIQWLPDGPENLGSCCLI